jgi:glycosyltransferase involved in cell wall biosynthesis
LNPEGPIRVIRAIGRLNVGGPSIQAITLTRHLEPLGYDTTLVRGVEGPREGSMDDLARELGVRPRLIGDLRRSLGPRDLVALVRMTRLLRDIRPHIVHTHAAKAGAVGRMACMLAGDWAPPIRVHTFHGHVLSEYFSPTTSALFRGIERGLARRTTRLIAVSDEVRADLLRLSIAPLDKIEVVRLGLDLDRFRLSVDDERRERARVRAELGLPFGAGVVLLVARLVQIKRVDRFLRIAARVASRTDAFFVIVGDGDLSEELHRSGEAQALGARLTWAGMRSDMPALMAAADVVVLTSDNEGTPVSLIEAHASGRPAVSSGVGGVSSVVVDQATGYVVPRGDEERFSDRVIALLQDGALARRLGQTGRGHVHKRFALDRLVRDIDGLYRGLLAEVRTAR